MCSEGGWTVSFASSPLAIKITAKTENKPKNVLWNLVAAKYVFNNERANAGSWILYPVLWHFSWIWLNHSDKAPYLHEGNQIESHQIEDRRCFS